MYFKHVLNEDASFRQIDILLGVDMFDQIYIANVLYHKRCTSLRRTFSECSATFNKDNVKEKSSRTKLYLQSISWRIRTAFRLVHKLPAKDGAVIKILHLGKRIYSCQNSLPIDGIHGGINVWKQSALCREGIVIAGIMIVLVYLFRAPELLPLIRSQHVCSTDILSISDQVHPCNFL